MENPIPIRERRRVRPKDLQKLYSLSKSTVTRYLDQMRESEYRDGIVKPSTGVVLIKLARFEEFLESIDGKYLEV